MQRLTPIVLLFSAALAIVTPADGAVIHRHVTDYHVSIDPQTHELMVDPYQEVHAVDVNPCTHGRLNCAPPAPVYSPASYLGSAAPAPSPTSPSAPLQAIAACESGGDPGAVSPDGTYRGKYQFTYETWASVGGVGDPAAAPEATQDALAARLYAEQGSSPWPVCGQ